MLRGSNFSYRNRYAVCIASFLDRFFFKMYGSVGIAKEEKEKRKNYCIKMVGTKGPLKNKPKSDI